MNINLRQSTERTYNTINHVATITLSRTDTEKLLLSSFKGEFIQLPSQARLIHGIAALREFSEAIGAGKRLDGQDWPHALI